MPSIHFPAGVTTLLSKTAQITNWREGNLVRWDDGVTLRPVGGWEQVPYAIPFASRMRAMHRWTALNGVVYTAYLCEQHIYVETGGALEDITPIGGMGVYTGSTAGYGELDYSESTYGTPRTGVSTIQKFSAAWS